MQSSTCPSLSVPWQEYCTAFPWFCNSKLKGCRFVKEKKINCSTVEIIVTKISVDCITFAFFCESTSVPSREQPVFGTYILDFHPPAAVNYCNLMPKDTGTLWVCPFWNEIILEEVSVCLSPLSQPFNLWGSLGIRFWVGAQQKGDRGRGSLGFSVQLQWEP